MIVPPKISVIMSVFNDSRYLKAAIDSILMQSFKDFEFIIINDGSTDNSKELIKSYQDNRIVLLDEKNKGLAASLNKGIMISKSHYIARMDADDIAHQDRLKLQHKFLEENHEYIVVGSQADVITYDDQFVYSSKLETEDSRIKAYMQAGIKNGRPVTPFFHSSVMIRKPILLKFGLYCEHMKKSQDVVLFNRLMNYGKYSNLNISLIKYRIKPRSVSIHNKKAFIEMGIILSEAINNNCLSDSSQQKLEVIIKSNSRNKEFETYIFIGKKYILNAKNRSSAVKYLFKAVKKRPFSIVPYFLFGFTLLPIFLRSLIAKRN